MSLPLALIRVGSPQRARGRVDLSGGAASLARLVVRKILVVEAVGASLLDRRRHGVQVVEAVGVAHRRRWR